MSDAKALRMITIDQIIAGASNLLIVLLAAHVTGNKSGLFGLLFLIYSMALGVSRALVGDPLLVHPREADTRPGEPIGASTLLGVAMGGLMLVAGVIVTIFSREFGYALMVLAIVIGPLMLQDLGRYLGFATKQPGRAVLLDTVWLVAVVVGAVALVGTHTHSLAWFIGVWGGTGGACAILTFWQYRAWPVMVNFNWIRFTWPFSWRYLISYSSNQGAALVGSSAVGAVAGTTALSGVTGTVALVRPFGTIQIAAVAAGVSQIARANLRPRQALSRGVKFSALTTAIAAVNGVILLVLPDKIGEIVLGIPVWHAAKPLLLANAAQILSLGVITGARAGMLGIRAVKYTVKIDVTTTVVVLVATVAGVAINGVLGALWAVAIGQAGMAFVWWAMFRWYVGTLDDVPIVRTDEPTAEHQAPEISAIATVVADQTSVASLGTRPLRELSPWAAWR